VARAGASPTVGPRSRASASGSTALGRCGRLLRALSVATLLGIAAPWPVEAAAAPPTRAAAPGPTSATVTLEDLSGADQYATAVAISQRVTAGGGAPVVYLVSGESYADALAAAPAAARDGGVVLYTGATSLPASVATELARLAPAGVRVVGGPAVVSDAVLAQVAIALPGAAIERVSGADAYATATALSAGWSPNTGATFNPITPTRVLDTRIRLGGSRLVSGVKQTFSVSGASAVPADAVAVTGNVTVAGSTGYGYVTIAPTISDGVAPSTSTLNFPTNDIRANGITVPLGSGGTLDAVYRGGTGTTAQVLFDVTGYFANDAEGTLYHALAPKRVLDSRSGLGAGTFTSGVKRTFSVSGASAVPADAVAVTGNVTVAASTGKGYVTIAPTLSDGVVPPTSTVNFPLGDIRANGITVPLATGGTLDAVYRGGAGTTADILFDVTGYFGNDSGGALFHALAPTRVLDSRTGLGAGVFASGVKQTFSVIGASDVPADAVAVTGNVTVAASTGSGYVTIAPALADGEIPTTSTLNFPLRDIRANGVTVPLGPGGTLDAVYEGQAGTTAQVLFDVTGYFALATGGATSHESATVVVASAADPAGAVVAGSIAAKLGVPFLLIARDSVPAATRAELARLLPSTVIVVGEAAVVPETTFRLVMKLVPAVTRVAGTDAFGTAAAAATRYFPGSAPVIATRAAAWTGGLAAVPLSKTLGAPILYVSEADLLPVPLRNLLAARRPTTITLTASLPRLTQAELLGFADGRLALPTDTTAYPAYDSGYHDPAEVYTIIRAEEIAYPTLVQVSSIGKSYQGRDIWVAKISDNVAAEESEPETLIDALHHACEHITVEQALYMLEQLTLGYGTDPLVTGIVDGRVTWIVFAVNPDGWAYDLSGGTYHVWRKNRQQYSTYTGTATDINRNYSYKWGCCGGSSSSPWAWNYRGTAPFSAPEAAAIRNFVASRVVGGKQRIVTHVTLHSNGELILYPYGYTRTALPADMKADDRATFVAMAAAMAALNGYTPKQSSGLYVTDGDEIDWMYGAWGIFSFTFELYPVDPSGATSAALCVSTDGTLEATACAGAGLVTTDTAVMTPNLAASLVYPPWSVIPGQTARNRTALLYAINMAACPYAAIGKAAQYCPGGAPIIP
jgi:carboxypeptidase T